MPTGTNKQNHLGSRIQSPTCLLFYPPPPEEGFKANSLGNSDLMARNSQNRQILESVPKSPPPPFTLPCCQSSQTTFHRSSFALYRAENWTDRHPLIMWGCCARARWRVIKINHKIYELESLWTPRRGVTEGSHVQCQKSHLILGIFRDFCYALPWEDFDWYLNRRSN